MNITVYLGALRGNDPVLKDAVKELGRWIGENNHTLIYGGSKSGLMGYIAESVLDAGGDVIGIEPQFFIDEELLYGGLTDLIITRDTTMTQEDFEAGQYARVIKLYAANLTIDNPNN